MKKTLFLGALVIMLFAASAWADDVSVDVSLGWGSHHKGHHHDDGYLQPPPAYYQWRSGNFYSQRFRRSLHGRRGYAPYYYGPCPYPYQPSYSYYRYYTPPTYRYYGYGYYGYGWPYYYRPRSGVRVRIEIGH
jgi:hypothetical protein